MSEREGAAHWLTIHDDLLRGMTHALSNRVATIMAATTLLELTDSVGQAGETLRGESERLETLLYTMRQLPRRRGQAPEPIMPEDIARAAIGLHEHHPEWRDIVCAVRLDGDVQPAWAEPGALQLAIAAVLGSAKRQAGASGSVVISVRSTDDVVRFDVRVECDDATDASGAVADGNRRDAEAASWLLAGCDGSATAHANGVLVAVPTLGAARRARGK